MAAAAAAAADETHGNRAKEQNPNLSHGKSMIRRRLPALHECKQYLRLWTHVMPHIKRLAIDPQNKNRARERMTVHESGGSGDPEVAGMSKDTR